MSKRSLATSNQIWRPMLRLAAPVMAEETLMLLVGYTDWWLTGHFLDGDAPRAAMSLMSYIMWLLPSLFAAVSIGATAIIARRVGEQRYDDANRTANQAMLMGAALAVVGTAVVLLTMADFPRWMQLSSDSADYATRYLRLVVWVIPLIMVEQVLAASLRGAGDTVTGFLAKSIVVVINLIVSTGLVTGWGFFPKLGWEGLAIGTACGHGVGGGLLLIVFLVGRSGLKLRRRLLRPQTELIRLLLKIGLPGGADIAAILFCQFVFVGLVNRLGDGAAAAHGLAVQIEALAYMPGSAFQVAAATMAGQFLGAGSRANARRSARACMVAGGVVMCSAALGFVFAGEHLTQFFLGENNQSTGVVAAELLKIVAVSMPALAICMIGAGTLRGSGDTRWPLVITLSGFCLIRIPLAAMLGWSPATVEGWWLADYCWGLGVQGAWYSMVVDLYLRAVLILARLWHGGWQDVKLPH